MKRNLGELVEGYRVKNVKLDNRTGIYTARTTAVHSRFIKTLLEDVGEDIRSATDAAIMRAFNVAWINNIIESHYALHRDRIVSEGFLFTDVRYDGSTISFELEKING